MKAENEQSPVLEDEIASELKRQGCIVLTRRNHCHVLGVKSDMALAYIVECKDYKLSPKQQRLAVWELIETMYML